MMFKQVKSALFWYYLYKFRKRVILIFFLLIIALFANAIYSDVVQYLTLKDKLQFLELALIGKWGVIIFNIVFSIYLILTMFKKEEKEIQKQEESKKNSSKFFSKAKISKEKTQIKKEEKFTSREKEFLYKKKLRSKADILVEN